MFLHAGIFHILFNMLALWMFGVELERMWGSRFFVQVLLRLRHRRGGDDDAAVVRAGSVRRSSCTTR